MDEGTNDMSEGKKTTRKEFLAQCGRGVGFLLLGGTVGSLASRNVRGGSVWQIEPDKCTQCGQCATHCVLDQSAVKCFQDFPLCGYCEFCTGFLELEPHSRNEGAENQICPVGAIKRTFVMEPYFEYAIDEDRCIGCGRCVETCVNFGNGSFYLQVRHDVCENCNECAIAQSCPADAFVRTPATKPYLSRQGSSST